MLADNKPMTFYEECLTIADQEGVWVLELFSVGKYTNNRMR